MHIVPIVIAWEGGVKNKEHCLRSTLLIIKIFFIKPIKMCTPVQKLRLCTGNTAHRGSRGIALLFRDHDTRRGEGESHAPTGLYPGGKIRCSLYTRLVGPQGRSGQVRKIWKNCILWNQSLQLQQKEQENTFCI